MQNRQRRSGMCLAKHYAHQEAVWSDGAMSVGSRAIMGLMSVLVVGLALSMAHAEAPVYVLSPAAEDQVRRLLAVERPLRGGRVPLRATIDRDRVLVIAGDPSAPAAAITLRHPDSGSGETIEGTGVALDASPGPAPRWALMELKRRMKAAHVSVSWIAPATAGEAEAKEAPPGAPRRTVHGIRTALRAASHRISTGELESARALLRDIPGPLDAEASLEVAVLWRLAGDEDKAREYVEAARTLEAQLSVPAAVVLGDTAVVSRALKDLQAESACAHMPVASMHERLGSMDRVVETASRIRELDPDCMEAWEMEIHGCVQLGQLDTAVERGKEGLEAFPGDIRMVRALASAHQARGDLDAAIPLLERAARVRPAEPGTLRVLLGAIVRDPELRAHHRVRLEQRLEGGGADVVDRFLLGVIRHYANEFEASNGLLRPLESELDHEDRLHIYLAMNDFNLDRVGPALVRLDRASRRSAPDPDIYYCLAEILRDRDRHRALEELRRYANLSQGDALSNPAKEERIRRLVAGLETCLADEREICEGEWEHPRLRARQEEEDRQQALVWTVGLILGPGVLLWLFVRRGRRADQAS